MYSWLALVSTLNFLEGSDKSFTLNNEIKTSDHHLKQLCDGLITRTNSSTHRYTETWTSNVVSSLSLRAFFSRRCSLVNFRAAFDSSWALKKWSRQQPHSITMHSDDESHMGHSLLPLSHLGSNMSLYFGGILNSFRAEDTHQVCHTHCKYTAEMGKPLREVGHGSSVEVTDL